MIEAGEFLKSSKGWLSDDYNTNESGFGWLPGGERTKVGAISGLGYQGHIWTSSICDSNVGTGGCAMFAQISYVNDNIIMTGTAYGSGHYVRLIKD